MMQHKEFDDLIHISEKYNIPDVLTKKNLDKKVLVDLLTFGFFFMSLKKLKDY